RPYLYLHSFPTRRSSDLQALAEASRVFVESGYLEAASQAATAVLAGARSPNDGWLRTGERGYQPAVAGFLDDYAYFVNGLISLRSEEHTSELQSRFDLVC